MPTSPRNGGAGDEEKNVGRSISVAVNEERSALVVLVYVQYFILAWQLPGTVSWALALP